MWIYVKLCEADVVEIWIGTYRNSIGTASEHHGLQCSDVDQILIRCCSDLLESEPISEQIFWNRCVSRMPWPTFIFAFLEPWLGWSKTRSPETLWDTLRHSETLWDTLRPGASVDPWSVCGEVIGVKSESNLCFRISTISEHVTVSIWRTLSGEGKRWDDQGAQRGDLWIFVIFVRSTESRFAQDIHCYLVYQRCFFPKRNWLHHPLSMAWKAPHNQATVAPRSWYAADNREWKSLEHTTCINLYITLIYIIWCCICCYTVISHYFSCSSWMWPCHTLSHLVTPCHTLSHLVTQVLSSDLRSNPFGERDAKAHGKQTELRIPRLLRVKRKQNTYGKTKSFRYASNIS